jgi:Ca2+-binding EF-hand superfamily protein
VIDAMDRWSNTSYIKRKESELRTSKRQINKLEEAFNNIDPTEEEMIDDPEIEIYAKGEICDKKERQLERAIASRTRIGSKM